VCGGVASSGRVYGNIWPGTFIYGLWGAAWEISCGAIVCSERGDMRDWVVERPTGEVLAIKVFSGDGTPMLTED